MHFHTRLVVLSVGSPALAAYSLVLTALNARSIYCRAQHIKPVARALISLQQIPLELTKDERLLAFIPINDKWKQEIVDRLHRRNAWSAATGFSVAWVVVAFLFNLVDSFVSLDDSVGGVSIKGHAVGTLWLWLLCLVIGWLWVPTFTCGELKSAIGHANQTTAKKAAKRLKQQATRPISSIWSKFTDRLPRRIQPERPTVDRSAQEETGPVGQETEPMAGPLPDPTHRRSIISPLRLSAEGQRGHSHSVSANPTANQSAANLSPPIHPETDRLLIPKDEENWLNRDGFRLSATFNYSRIMRYLVLVDDVLRALNRLTRETEVGISRNRLILEVASLIRNSSLSLKPLPLDPRGTLCSPRERSFRCSMRRFSPLFSSAERPPQPR